MAGSVTISYSETRTVKKITLAWTSDASGAVNGTLTKKLSGTIQRIIFVPGSGGSQPTDLYDMTIEDEQGMDILAGQGANLSNANTTNVTPGSPLEDGTTTSVVPQTIDDTLELKITAAGNAKSGTVYLFLR